MTTAATISIQLEAQTALLQKGFADARGQVRGFRHSMERQFRLLKAAAAVQIIGQVTQAVRQLGAALTETADRVAAQGDFADRLGMSPESLQLMRAMVTQFGGNANSLNTALQRMTRRIADAEARGGPLADRLQEMGLNLQELAALSPDEQFLAFSDAIIRTNDAGAQLAATVALMDVEGAAMVGTLRQGSRALQEWQDRMRGVVSLTDEEVRQAQELSAAMELINRQIEVAADRLLLKLVPTIKTLSYVLIGAIDQFGRILDYAERIGQSWVEWWLENPTFFEELEKQRGKPLPGFESLEEYRALLGEVKALQQPGALTSTSASGFGALQEWLRQEKDSTYERDMLAKMDTLIEVTADDRVDVVEYSV